MQLQDCDAELQSSGYRVMDAREWCPVKSVKAAVIVSMRIDSYIRANRRASRR